MQTWRISKGNILCFGAIKAHNNGNTSEHLLSKCSFQKCKKNQLHSLTLFKNYLPLGGADEVLCFRGETNSQQSRVTLEEVSECGLLFCCFFVFLFFPQKKHVNLTSRLSSCLKSHSGSHLIS